MYLDYDWYSSHFGKVPQKKFEEYRVNAEHVVDVRTSYRAEKAFNTNPIVTEKIKWAVLRTMDAQFVADTTGVSSGKISVSNDGYSESYAAKNGQADIDKHIRTLIFRELSGTGLMGAM